MTEIQVSLKSGSTNARMVADWGSSAQNKCDCSLRQIAGHKGIPSVADVNIVFGNAVMVAIVSDHLRGILRYVGIDVSANALQANQILAMQILDTANIIASNYYYLNLMELALFFREIKSGKRGQVVWGTKLNTQELMVRLSEFVSDRACAIEKNEMEEKKETEKKSFSTIKQAGAAITEGVYTWRQMLEQSKTDFNLFLSLFPKFPENLSPTDWHKAWLGDNMILQQIFGSNIPDNYDDLIIKSLCNYNVEHK